MARYGVPRKPPNMDAAAEAQWSETLRHMNHRICPTPDQWHPTNISNGRRGASRASSITPTSSGNWAGYEATSTTGHHYYWVRGDWFIPGAMGCSPSNAYASTWVGLGGDKLVDEYSFNGGNLVQNGFTVSVDANCNYSGYAWYEDWPRESTSIALEYYDFTFSPGDHVYVSSDSNYTMGNAEFYVWGDWGPNTTYPGEYWSYFEYAPLSDGSTAEWITEDPPGYTLANFGAVGYMGLEAVYDTSTKWIYQLNLLRIEMQHPDPPCSIHCTMVHTGDLVNGSTQFVTSYWNS